MNSDPSDTTQRPALHLPKADAALQRARVELLKTDFRHLDGDTLMAAVILLMRDLGERGKPKSPGHLSADMRQRGITAAKVATRMLGLR